MSTDCLRCMIGGIPVALPLQEVSKISEYVTSPAPPLAQDWVAGLALLEEHVWVSLRFHPKTARSAGAAPSTKKGVLFKESAATRRWALEIDDVIGLGVIENVEEKNFPVKGWMCPPPWVRKARTRDGQDLAMIDTAAIASKLRAVTVEG